ncbi:hypothetical protein EV360DRAFT_88969 [Lentinula raphanica]|nr:hypothetical protein EV360DRAFT_88969 [Lentinula raphanica]
MSFSDSQHDSMEVELSSVQALNFNPFHPNFPYQPGCVVVRSQDGLLFGLDVDRLWAASGQKSFNTTCSILPGVADAPYPSHILARLFMCLCPKPFPSFEDMDVDELVLFGKAAAAFRIHSAIALDIAHFRRHVHKHPKVILSFAVQYGYDSLIKAVAATDFVRAPLSEVAQILPDSLFRTWCLHRDSLASNSIQH